MGYARGAGHRQEEEKSKEKGKDSDSVNFQAYADIPCGFWYRQ